MASIQQQTHLRNGLPAGGTAGQIPVKQSNTDFDVTWENPTITPDSFETGFTVADSSISLAPATDTELGGIKIGVGLVIVDEITSVDLGPLIPQIPVVTTSNAGFLSAEDKIKLDSISANANNYTLPTATTNSLGGVKVDGTTITITDGVISSVGGSGGSGGGGGSANCSRTVLRVWENDDIGDW